MDAEPLLLVFEPSPEDPRLTGVDEAIRAFGAHGIDVEAAAKKGADGGLVASLLRFWFPYLSHAGVLGVTPDEALASGEFNVTLAAGRNPAFGAVLEAWLQARAGRKIRMRIGDLEMEAHAPEQIELLLSRLEALRGIGAPTQTGG